MSDPNPKATARARFRVIEGGKSSKATSAEPPYVQSSRVTPAEQEENQLRVAILQLPVHQVGQSVCQVLQEMCDKLDTGLDADFARVAFLRARLEEMGLRLALARPEMELAREAYLQLSWPDRLARRHPSLLPYHPVAHGAMLLG